MFNLKKLDKLKHARKKKKKKFWDKKGFILLTQYLSVPFKPSSFKRSKNWNWESYSRFVCFFIKEVSFSKETKMFCS